MRYLVIDPCFESDDLVAALETRLNELADQGWRLAAVVPVRGRRQVAGETIVSEDAIDALVLEKPA